MCWSAFHELCDMGVQFDLEKIYSLSLSNAAEILQQFASQDPSTDMKEMNSKLFFKKKKSAVPSLMEKRKSVEKIRDYRCSPVAATSLGLSSCAVRIGFATPGGMPSPSMAPLSMGQMSLLSNTHMSIPPTNYSIDPSLSERTPLQVTSNPLQYLLQSRYQTQRGGEEMKSHDHAANEVTPTPHVSKHLFPVTTEPTPGQNRMKSQLFGTPDAVDPDQSREYDILNESILPDGRDQLINLRGIATPGLTPIERNFRHVGGDPDHSVAIDGEDDLLVYGKSTQKIEKNNYTLDDDEDTSIEVRQIPLPRDEVRRRVSFGPMMEEKHEGSGVILCV